VITQSYTQVIQQFKIEWGQPFSNILEAMELMAFDLDRFFFGVKGVRCIGARRNSFHGSGTSDGRQHTSARDGKTRHTVDISYNSMILPTYPGKIPRTSLNPHKDRNSFINCW